MTIKPREEFWSGRQAHGKSFRIYEKYINNSLYYKILRFEKDKWCLQFYS